MPGDALLRYTVPMPDDSLIPGRAAEKVALNGSVLSTLPDGGSERTELRVSAHKSTEPDLKDGSVYRIRWWARVRWTLKTGQARSSCGLSWSLLTDSLYQDLPAESSQYGTLWPTKLDKIKNLHHYLQSGTVSSHRAGPAAKPAWKRAASYSRSGWSSVEAPDVSAGASGLWRPTAARPGCRKAACACSRARDGHGHAISGSCPLALRHAVAHPRLGKYVGGVVGVVAQLATEPLHHFANQPGFAGPFRTPDPMQQLVVGQHPPGVD